MIRISDNLGIDEGEIRFTFSCSPGPGGQNVNKVATTATLLFDVAASRCLSEPQKQRVREVLGGRIKKDGVLWIVARRHRTQVANRQDAIRRFTTLLAEALRPRIPRKKTRPTAGSRERRLAEKAKRSRRKADRSAGRGFTNDS